MSKYLKMLGAGIKYSLYLGGATLVGSLTYLQYVNYNLGSIDIDREAMVIYYTDKSNNFNFSESEAKNMYYWLLLDVSMMRVLTYSSYTTSCAKIIKKIIDQSLKNYEEKGIIKEIETVNSKPNPSKEKRIFNDILTIRRANFENIENYEFIVKELRKQQKLMDTRKIIGLDEDRVKKIETIHKFLCKFGEVYKNQEIMRYNEQVPGL
jgi:hypothetical protein